MDRALDITTPALLTPSWGGFMLTPERTLTWQARLPAEPKAQKS
jgi:hypothetical protein